MHFWCGVSAIAGALRRKTWIQPAHYFRWYPNFYIILVAPPGVVSKSTTASIAMRLLRQVPGIKFGPDVVTWQALVSAFAEAQELFDLGNGDMETMCAITIESSEFGNLLNPQDKQMVDLLVALWDGKPGLFEKKTKMSGTDQVENPWINLVACTTPAWIAGNFPEYMIGGGFTSRCLFIYAEEKQKLVAYPFLTSPIGMEAIEKALVRDLEHIAVNIKGEYHLTKPALEWGIKWYEYHNRNKPEKLDDDRFGAYIARKQTHVHKLAIILAASQRDELTITPQDLETANQMVTDLEEAMPMVFSKIGRTDLSLQTDRFLGFVKKRGEVSYREAYGFIHSHFPSFKEFEDVVNGCIRAGLINQRSIQNGSGVIEITLISTESRTAAEPSKPVEVAPSAKLLELPGRKAM